MDILMPQLGETVTEGKIIGWFKAVGDAFAPGDTLFEIETDKVSMEVPATNAGSLTEIRVKTGEVAPVGAVVAVISGVGDVALPTPATAPVAASPPPPAVAAPTSVPVKRVLDPFNAVPTPPRNFGPAALASGVRVTPLARRLAATAGIDLNRVKGSGPRGRIVAIDIEAALSSPAAPSSPVPIATPASAPVGMGLQQVKALYEDAPYIEVELDGMRRVIAERLQESKQTVPHFYLSMDINIENMLDLRRRINASRGIKVSVNDFVVTAFAKALAKAPDANAVWAEDRILRFSRVDIGIAVAVEGGLFTPVVRGAEAKSLSVISSEIKDLAQRARDRKLKPQEYKGGAAAVSNLGMYGVRQFSAIISPPHATILAVGAGERRPVEAADGSVRFETLMTVTLSCDHRVVDGALGARLLSHLKAILEEPLLALI
jgi:pyruvate dehydrogenase E2 component (dihydrolipoamide acetyltransferase)